MSTKKIKYTIKLLSDTCCGTGSGNGSDVDIAASFDETGLPIIPAMRLRGLLREQAFILAEKYGETAVKSLFGDSGQKSRLTVSTATIKNADEIKNDLLANESVSKREVSEVFSVKRASTAIDAQTGTAKTGSLRTISAVKAGVIFEGSVSVYDASDIDISIIKDSFSLLRSIGLNKHRGLGEVSCTTEAPVILAEAAVSNHYTPDDILCKCDYTLKLNQNVALMLNSPMQAPNYIPGASVQGAIAKLFVGQPFFDKLIFDDLRIGNAYISEISSNGTTFAFRPTPLSYVMIKNESNVVYDLADGAVRQSDKQYVQMGGYVYDDGRFVSKHGVKTGTDYHINKGSNNKVAKKEFRNTVILSKGQSFVGTLFGSRSALELVKKALNGSMITIGAAGASEYGECIVVIDSIEKDNNQRFEKGSKVVAELISDAVILNNCGTNSARLCDLVDSISGPGAFKVLSDKDGRSLVFSKTEIVGGYNAKWGMPKQQATAFSKGSTVLLECLKDVSLGSFIGIRNDEGYGQVEYHRQNDRAHIAVEELQYDRKHAVRTGKANDIIVKIEKKRLDRDAEMKALEAVNALHSDTLSNSAAMRLLSLYQALRASNKLTISNFNTEVEKFNKNKELLKLAKSISKDFSGTGLDNELFEIYLRTFLTRYKEKSRQNKTDAKNMNGGND